MAMKKPTPGIVSIERDSDRALHRNKNCVTHGAAQSTPVDPDHLEMVPMKVHRMRHHRGVAHLDHHALPEPDFEWPVATPGEIVDRPDVFAHVTRECDLVDDVGRSL